MKLFIETPSALNIQSSTWLSYKHHNTFKGLIRIYRIAPHFMEQYFHEFRDLTSDHENFLTKFSIIVGVVTFCAHMCIASMIVRTCTQRWYNCGRSDNVNCSHGCCGAVVIIKKCGDHEIFITQICNYGISCKL